MLNISNIINVHNIPVKWTWKAKHKGKGEGGQRTSWDPCCVQHDLFLPAGVELNVRVKEAHDRRRGRVPAVYSGSDQALPLAVPHDLHQARVTLVDILVQVEFQFHWKRADHRRAL